MTHDETPCTADEPLNLSAVSVTSLLKMFISGSPAMSGRNAQGIVESFFRSLLVVVPTYLLAAFGLRWNGGGIDIKGPDLSYALAAIVVLMFTLTHGVVPVFFYAIFNAVVRALRNVSYGVL